MQVFQTITLSQNYTTADVSFKIPSHARAGQTFELTLLTHDSRMALIDRDTEFTLVSRRIEST